MKLRILVVDEAAFVRDALKRSLRRFLKEVEIFDAVNAHRALPILRTNKINLIISDWELGDNMSGKEFLTWLRGEEAFAKIPFIVTSDEGDKKIVMAAIEAGANDFMAKPFTPEEVQRKVTKQLARFGFKSKASAPQNSGFGSVEALTGGGGNSKPKAQPQKSRQVTAAAGFGKPASSKPKAKTKAAPKAGNFDGVAHLHFSGYSLDCKVSELSLTAINATFERASSKQFPTVFDAVKADIENSKGEPIGQLNAYVHSLQAGSPKPNAEDLKISLRFADNKPEQFEQLSKAIARGR